MSEIECVGYGKQYSNLDLNLFNNNRKMYEVCKIEIMLDELQNNNFFSKWNKPTKKGTNVNFKVIKTKEIYKSEKQKIIDYTNELNDKFNFGFTIESEEKEC